MLLTINKEELKSIEGTLECIGLERVKIQEVFEMITAEEVSYYVDSIKLANKLSQEEIDDINKLYGEIIKIKATDDEYTIWINPSFVKDYVELYRDVTVGLIKVVIDSYYSLRLIIKPIIESFTSKWKSLL